MALALNADYPILDLFWTMLMAFGLALFVYLLIVVFRDLFTRDDLSALGKTGWVALVLVFPLVGCLAYLIQQSGPMGERMLARNGGTQLNMDAYARSVSGDGGYRGVRDVTRTRQAMAGPIRPA